MTLCGLRELLDQLPPACERLKLAGAHRRGLEADRVDIVCIPRWEWRGTMPVNLLQRWTMEHNTWAWNTTDPAAVVYRGTMPDGRPAALWQAQEGSFGSILLARTGPPTYSKMIQERAAALGMSFDGGSLIVGGVPVSTPEERDVFSYLKLPYVPPVARV